jgi:hypothetical protein
LLSAGYIVTKTLENRHALAIGKNAELGHDPPILAIRNREPITTTGEITMKTLAMKKLTLALVVLSTAAMAATASAESLLSFATRTGNAAGSSSQLVALKDNGSTDLAFRTTGPNKTIKITYNAECASGGPAESWVSVTVLVDGVQANPKSGTAFALCSSLGNDALDWKGAVRQSLITVPAAGGHVVQVRVDPNGGATYWELGDSSIVVEQK